VLPCRPPLARRDRLDRSVRLGSGLRAFLSASSARQSAPKWSLRAWARGPGTPMSNSDATGVKSQKVRLPSGSPTRARAHSHKQMAALWAPLLTTAANDKQATARCRVRRPRRQLKVAATSPLAASPGGTEGERVQPARPHIAARARARRETKRLSGSGGSTGRCACKLLGFPRSWRCRGFRMTKRPEHARTHARTHARPRHAP
jgi:hypothetical protein